MYHHLQGHHPILRCLEKNPSRRFSSAEELSQTLADGHSRGTDTPLPQQVSDIKTVKADELSPTLAGGSSPGVDPLAQKGKPVILLPSEAGHADTLSTIPAGRSGETSGRRRLILIVLTIAVFTAILFALYPKPRAEWALKFVLEVDTSGLTPEEAKDAGDRAYEVIARRLKEFGAKNSVLQPQGDNRILVTVPVTKQEIVLDRVSNLICQRAILEFRVLKEAEAFRSLLNRIDERLAARQKASGTDPTGGEDRAHALTSLLTEYGSDIVTPAENADRVRAVLADLEAQDLILAEDGMVLWAAHVEDVQGQKILPIYYVKRRPEMTGEVIADARAQLGKSSKFQWVTES